MDGPRPPAQLDRREEALRHAPRTDAEVDEARARATWLEQEHLRLAAALATWA